MRSTARFAVAAQILWTCTGCGAGSGQTLPSSADAASANPAGSQSDASRADAGTSTVTDASTRATTLGDATPGAAALSRDAEPSGPGDAARSSNAPDGSPAPDGDSSSADAAGADASSLPFKGVANSACNDLQTLGAAWYYNWTLSPGCSTPQFVPMVWGHSGAEQTAAGIASEVKTLVGKGYTTVLGFNEPDNTSQSNIAVATALSLWLSFAATSVRLGSPATQANSSGQAWFRSFMSAVNADTTGSLRVDFIAAHWYGWNGGSCDAKASNLEGYIGFLESIPGNRPIWLTEWGCLNQSNPDAATVQAFYEGALAMFSKHPRIERYAWYPWEANNELVTSSDQLTPLGSAFAAAPAHKP